MADLRIPPSLPAVPTAATARSSEAVRAAQRAFFDTALSNTGAAPATRRAAPVAAATPSPTVVTPLRAAPPPAGDAQAAPTRLLRPGSLLDIRI